MQRLHPSPNIEPRRDGRTPRILLLHYTGLPTLERAIDVLSRPDCKVSCHYVVGEDGETIQMVAESMRAWHAGESYWAGETDINSLSIGIEIQNAGHAAGYPEFPALQMHAVKLLCNDILTRHSITPQCVLAHSDVAPARKCDPGEKFNWAALAESGVGLWVKPAPIDASGRTVCLGDTGSHVMEAQQLLTFYGYQVPQSGRFDQDTAAAVRAFQRHFRQGLCDGRFDASSRDTLLRLLAARDALVNS